MRLFKKTRKTDGWLALIPKGERLAAASVARPENARPVVQLAAIIEGGAQGAGLEKAGRALHASRYQVSTVLSGGHYQMLSVDAPNVPPDELRTAVRWRLKDMLDFHIDDASIDVLDIPVDKTAAVHPHAMFAIAARNSVIEQRQKQFALAKIQLLAIDIPEMAQRNIAALLETAGRGLAMLSFDADGGLLTVSFQGELYLSRRIDVTLEQLLDPEHERKHQRFEKITLELQRSLDHFDRQFHFISVARLLLAPSPVTGLEEYLSSNLYTPVARFDLADVFDIAAVPELAAPDLQQQLFIALGAALRREEKAL
ncbi:type IV pilus biogenesis protein PilM [Massilia sp. S19_KUP03_FR1]|uniref:type IV pilus biogenesis protein PilM n=1 Tax=Massilia sp. S19_KUP03_FR1 TaxID=3025503 RepID=UPI002FCD988E